MNPRVKSVRPMEGVRLEITVSNGEIGIHECSSPLDLGVFTELKDESCFPQARVATGTVVWPHEQDICPDTPYLDSEKMRKRKTAEAGLHAGIIKLDRGGNTQERRHSC